MTRTHGMIRPRAPWVFPREPEAVRKVFEDLGEKRTYADGAFPERDEAFLVTHGFVLLFFPVYEDAGENPAVGVVPPGAALDATEASERPLAVAYAACFGPVEGAALRESVLLWEAAASPALLPLFRANAIRKENAMLEGLAARALSPEDRLHGFLFASILSTGTFLQNDWNAIPFGIPQALAARVTGARITEVRKAIRWWKSAGLARREGRRLFLHGELFRRHQDCLWYPDPAGRRPVPGERVGRFP